MSDGRSPEVLLHGGTTNRGLVVRVGATVRRPRRPTSPATEHLLQHLEGVGFQGAPRFLGVDERGREVLTYVPGETVTPPYPVWSLTDNALASVARLLRRYHDAVATYDPSGRTWPKPVPTAYQEGLVSHNDPNLDNVVFRAGEAVALIDFDLAGPGSRLWDLAGAARLWTPLRRDDDVADARRGRVLPRARLFLDAYGPDAADRTGTDGADLLGAVLAHHDWSYEIADAAAGQGHPAFFDYLAGGAGARAARTRQWYEQDAALSGALSRPGGPRSPGRTSAAGPRPASG